MSRGGQHTVPSGARKNRPFAGQESPFSRRNAPPRHFIQLETLNLKLGTRRRRVPLFVPDLPALYGLFRAKKYFLFSKIKHESAPAILGGLVVKSISGTECRGFSDKSRTCLVLNFTASPPWSLPNRKVLRAKLRFL